MLKLKLFGSQSGLVRVELAEDEQFSWHWETACPAELASPIEEWLTAYRARKRQSKTLPLVWPKQSAFAQKVYEEMQAIPAGLSCSYGELAQRAGNPRAARAVGTLCNRNPFPLLVPCHRVVAASGLGGFAYGSGLKERMLAWESAL
jgi:methylated-DNA-[protein]-cysteine S-methyltransferase